ncbi:hypothetical protein V5P93_003534 [Actinokineospora auranticolor]|uniref:Uncharacterized protein n=1 Tax=Actinokineospora auranticolor TaxID=155976 RepID=A0A2S6GPS0_9PSEU|nr:hypothetical protein [Actinokineospora auranticolor]PPK67196.1 hypothetical protein CLV40_108194 [Actinokineospora auranticolor]
MLASPVWRGVPALAFRAGLLVGGALSAVVLLVVGSLLRAPVPQPVRWVLIGVALLAVVLRDVRVLRFTLPENRRLVPESVFRLGRLLGPLQFGIEMGTGARTYLPSGLPYVAGLAVLLTAPLSGALWVGVGFGLGRALMTTANLNYPGDWDEQWTRYANRLAALLGTGFVVALLGAAWVTAPS